MPSSNHSPDGRGCRDDRDLTRIRELAGCEGGSESEGTHSKHERLRWRFSPSEPLANSATFQLLSRNLRTRLVVSRGEEWDLQSSSGGVKGSQGCGVVGRQGERG